MKFFNAIMFILIFSINCYSAEKIKILYISPATENDNLYKISTDFMKDAANDLGIELHVLYISSGPIISRIPRSKIKTIEQTLKNTKNIDYVVHIAMPGLAKDVLKILEKYKIKSFLYNSFFTKKIEAEFGKPREKYKYLIGSMSPNERAIGRKISDLLIQKALKQGLAVNNQIHMIGIGGWRTFATSDERITGLKQSTEANKHNAKLQQVVHSNWSRKAGYSKAKGLLKRYPYTSVIWTVADNLAIGALPAIKELGYKPGFDMLIGGVDWTIEGLKKTKQGLISFNGGGHIAEGAMIMALLYDYHHGIDFADETGTIINYEMTVLTPDTAGKILQVLQTKEWKKIDFRRYSKKENPNLTQHDFNSETIFKHYLK